MAVVDRSEAIGHPMGLEVVVVVVVVVVRMGIARKM
jgi:hypothetical protein